MIEFKQIIWPGSCLFDGKFYFTIVDFVNAFHLFLDDEWDGEPMEPGDTGDGTGGTGSYNGGDDDGVGGEAGEGAVKSCCALRSRTGRCAGLERGC